MEHNFSTPKSPFKNPEEEMQYLRNLIREKETALNSLGIKKDDTSTAREVLATYKRVPSREVMHDEVRLSDKQVEDIVLKLSPEQHDKKINELVRLAKEKGIKNALDAVEKMQNFHITDDFHRFVSEYLKEGFTIPGLKSKEAIAKGLGMALYEVLIPEGHRDEDESRKESLKEVISAMEQLYAGMLSVSGKSEEGLWMSIEVANPNFTHEISFYVAIPDTRKYIFEKQIHSIFYNVKVKEIPDDYNIFNETGETVGAYAAFTKRPIYPIKTYDKFDHDPLNSILASFSKVNKDGEGAAIQIIWMGVGDEYNKKYKDALDKIQKGEPLEKAIDIPESFADEMFKTVGGLFSSSKKEEDQKPKDPIDQNAVESINEKIASPIIRANVRILASSTTKKEAEEILDGLKSGFNQFENTLGNSLKWYTAEKGNLRKLVRSFAFRIFDQSSALALNLKELTTLVHFNTRSLKSGDNLKQSRAATAPAPLDLKSGGIVLGVNKHRGQEVVVNVQEEDRLRHFYCIGQTGTGKSTLLKNMIIQDIKSGDGVCMIDPHGSDVQNILANIPEERLKDVIYFDPSFVERPMALNMLEYDERFPEQKTFVVNELFSIFRKLYGNVPESMGPAFEQYFRNSALLVMDDPASGNTLVDMSRVLSDKTYRDLKLSRCRNPLVRQFWQNAEKTTGEQGLANYVQYVTNKFDVFLANEIMRPVVAQEKSSFNFREIMDNKKILLVNLSKGRLGDINAHLIGLILVGKILMAALSRVDSFGKELPPFYLYIDEFQNITTDSITTILSEARKYRLSLNMAHQFIAQLEEGIRDSVFGNVGSVCSFRVGAEDAEYLEKQFVPSFSANDLMNIDNRNAYLRLLVNGKPAKPFNIEVLAPEQGNMDQVEKLKQMSYQKYGRDRGEVEKIILEKYKG